MELGYLRRLDMRTAGRINFGECARPAVQFDAERSALELAANALDDLAREPSLSRDVRQVIAAAALTLMKAGY
ncbi:hypothetical protein MKK75_05655 [Methylobacterium sp. J-030]|uniref:hypothetical protein n=1 Tax=Methylobacterium sp. J-030 TaxID=2836627 RepID=UPI001FB97CAE|nr:hypothetical protein [Methylobacterium sp. J-030]MCJ2068297.1 hypothetical protein [Methylobacterium sp. J-030]